MSGGAVVIIINPPKAKATDPGSAVPAALESACISHGYKPSNRLTISIDGFPPDVTADEVIDALYAAAARVGDRRSRLAFANLPPEAD